MQALNDSSVIHVSISGDRNSEYTTTWATFKLNHHADVNQALQTEGQTKWSRRMMGQNLQFEGKVLVR